MVVAVVVLLLGIVVMVLVVVVVVGHGLEMRAKRGAVGLAGAIGRRVRVTECAGARGAGRLWWCGARGGCAGAREGIRVGERGAARGAAGAGVDATAGARRGRAVCGCRRRAGGGGREASRDGES